MHTSRSIWYLHSHSIAQQARVHQAVPCRKRRRRRHSTKVTAPPAEAGHAQLCTCRCCSWLTLRDCRYSYLASAVRRFFLYCLIATRAPLLLCTAACSSDVLPWYKASTPNSNWSMHLQAPPCCSTRLRLVLLCRHGKAAVAAPFRWTHHSWSGGLMHSGKWAEMQRVRFWPSVRWMLSCAGNKRRPASAAAIAVTWFVAVLQQQGAEGVDPS